MYVAELGVALALYVAMERRARQATPPPPEADLPELRELVGSR